LGRLDAASASPYSAPRSAAGKGKEKRLVHFKGLSNLRYVHLDSTQVTDAGLVHLKGLTSLKELFLHGTQVTDEAVKKLQQDLPNCTIRH
jgi:hypothetical protein